MRGLFQQYLHIENISFKVHVVLGVSEAGSCDFVLGELFKQAEDQVGSRGINKQIS